MAMWAKRYCAWRRREVRALPGYTRGARMRHKVKHVHFIGIGGSGMSGIAEVLLNLDYVVTGSDLSQNAAVNRLQSLGAKVMIGHNAGNIAGADVVVVSSAVKSDNPEVTAARAVSYTHLRAHETRHDLVCRL